MELCSGTLDEYVNGVYEGPRFRNAREILRQVTRGLAHLHKLKIVHRDIKPANLLIFVPTGESNQPQMNLADFDISKMLKTEKNMDFTNTSPTNPKGTKGWMAPEVYESNRIDRIRKKEPMVLTEGDLKNNNNNGAFELIKSMLMLEPMRRPTVTGVWKEPFLKDEDRTAKFLSICEAFITRSITYGKIVQFKELVRDETVDVNATTITKYGEEMSPLHLVIRYNYKNNLIELFKDLLLNGADVNAKAKNLKTKKDGTIINGLTPLHLLFGRLKNRNMIDIIQLLLENGADVNAENEHGTTPFHYLFRNYKHDNLKDIAQLLIEKGTDVNAKTESGMTTLHYLCRSYINDNLKDIVQLLIEKGADINAKTISGMTPLHYVCRYYTNDRITGIVQIMIGKGADVNAKDKDGWTSLRHLCTYNRRYIEMNERDKETLRIYLNSYVENGTNIDANKDEYGEMPSNLFHQRGLDNM